jgi:hypothetical protein
MYRTHRGEMVQNKSQALQVLTQESRTELSMIIRRHTIYLRMEMRLVNNKLYFMITRILRVV